MKLAWILFAFTMCSLLAFAIWQNKNIKHENIVSDKPQSYEATSANGGSAASKQSFLGKKPNGSGIAKTEISKEFVADSIIAFGLSLKGTPYLAAGITQEGFDCSGFVSHVYDKHGIKLPHSSALLAKEGVPVDLSQARKGDLLIFTGTNEADRTPGHVGIVLTHPGEKLEFIHASSDGGVKISKVDSTGYTKRFLQVRRVL
ncbi:C40 family peptidase [Adhaeribacter aquaticus]|uniref:C40 family peptidase n=1 Tax=Adhaeribacter aquaticus TaxID=299567 RepID=UPI0004103782|nr:C40 family peptidase [Adhaeribacter aquaticus]